MSKTNKRKHVMKEMFDDEYKLPETNQRIVKIVKSMGNNLHEIVTPENESYLVSMPVKFRNNIWVKRGNFVLIEPILEGKKVKGEIVRILSSNSIKHFKQNDVWPNTFNDEIKKEEILDDDNLFVNTNRPVHTGHSNLSSTSSSEESDDSDT